MAEPPSDEIDPRPAPVPSAPRSPPTPMPPAEAVESLGWEDGKIIARRYELQRRLGDGSMGEVWLAEDRLLRKPVALKVLQRELAQSRDTVRRFLREVALAHSVTHPNVVRIYDTGEEGGLPFFTMEYLQGQTLEELLERGAEGRDGHERLSFEEIRDISFDVLDGMEAAHLVGVVHRDLKPGNVMLTHRGAIVMDFGVAGIDDVPDVAPSASQVRSLVRTEAGTIFGSPAYMAPELWEGEAASVRSDLYAFGVMLYQMITSRLPYEAKTPAAYLQKLSAGHPPPIRSMRRDTPWNLVRLVRRCMATDPGERPASAAAATNLIAPLRSRPRRRLVLLASSVVVAAAALLLLRSRPAWREYGLPDPVAEADLAAAVRAYDVGETEAASRRLERLAERAPDSAAVAFWRATMLDELGDDDGRLEACGPAESWRGSVGWRALAEAACGPVYTLGPPATALLEGSGDAVSPELLPLAVSHDLVPRVEAHGSSDEARERAVEILDRLADEPDWSPAWAMPVRWQVARADLELALGRIGEASERLTELAETYPRAPLAQARAAWLATITGNSARARELAARVRPIDPTPWLRLELDDGRLDEAWHTVEALAGTRRAEGLRTLWCGYAWRFGATTTPAHCHELPPGLVRSLWAHGDDETPPTGPLQAAIVERRHDVEAGACDPDRDPAPLLTHAPPPFESYLAELDVEAAMCEQAPARGDMARAEDLVGRLTGAVPRDPWLLLLRAQVYADRGADRQAEADRLAVADRWRDADAWLPLVGRLREATTRAGPPSGGSIGRAPRLGRTEDGLVP